MERRYSESKDSRELAFAGQEFLFRFSDDRCNICAHNPNESCLVWSEDTACGAIEQKRQQGCLELFGRRDGRRVAVRVNIAFIPDLVESRFSVNSREVPPCQNHGSIESAPESGLRPNLTSSAGALPIEN